MKVLSKNTLVGIGIAGVILIVAIIWLLVGRQQGEVTTLTPTPIVSPLASPEVTETPVATKAATPSASKNEVVVTTAGFNPKTIEITAGSTATWVNNGTVATQVASTPHPIHTDYPPLNSVGIIQPGQSKSLKFDKAGTYRYHNHLNPASLGTVIVK